MLKRELYLAWLGRLGFMLEGVGVAEWPGAFEHGEPELSIAALPAVHALLAEGKSCQPPTPWLMVP